MAKQNIILLKFTNSDYPVGSFKLTITNYYNINIHDNCVHVYCYENCLYTLHIELCIKNDPSICIKKFTPVKVY